MVESRIYSVVVFLGGHECFYGTFSNRKNMFDSIKENIDLTGTYIKGSRKNLDVTPVTIANGFVNNGLTIYKTNEDNEEIFWIKILMHSMNTVNSFFNSMKEKYNEA